MKTLFLTILILCLTVIGYSFYEWFTLNGEEPDFEPEKWKKYLKGNNCYAYALDNFGKRKSKPQPDNQDSDTFNCRQLKRWIRRDLIDENGIEYKNQMIKGTANKPCPKGTHKIYLVHSDDDYHFYRLDSDGFWSHKPGATKVTRLDASGKMISDPAQADHDYGKFNYRHSCGFLCVPTIDEKF